MAREGRGRAKVRDSGNIKEISGRRSMIQLTAWHKIEGNGETRWFILKLSFR